MDAPASRLVSSSSASSVSGAGSMVRVASAPRRAHGSEHIEVVGEWIAARLVQLQIAEAEALRSQQQGIAQAQAESEDDDPSLWDAHKVGEWLRTTVRLPPTAVNAVVEQEISGAELFTFDDADFAALGCSLAERKRVLGMVRQLRVHAATKPPPLTLKTSASGHAALQVHLSNRRERLNVLNECFQKVLLHLAPTVPLKTRRLLQALWNQNENVGQEALARAEKEAMSVRRREEAVAERGRRNARKLVEAQMKLLARTEDMLHETTQLLRFEKQKLEALRESMFTPLENPSASGAKDGADGGEEASAEGSRARVRRYGAADFAASNIPPTLGDEFLHVGGLMQKMITDSERGGVQTQSVLIRAAGFARSLEAAQEEDAVRRKHEEEARKKKAAIAVSLAGDASAHASPSKSSSRNASRPSSGKRHRGARLPTDGSGT